MRIVKKAIMKAFVFATQVMKAAVHIVSKVNFIIVHFFLHVIFQFAMQTQNVPVTLHVMIKNV